MYSLDVLAVRKVLSESGKNCTRDAVVKSVHIVEEVWAQSSLE